MENRLTINDTRYTTTTTTTFQSNHNIIVYSGLIGGAVLLGLMRGLLFFKVATDASQKLHNSMFACIIRARIGFFDKNPIGKITCNITGSSRCFFFFHFFNRIIEPYVIVPLYIVYDKC